MNRNRLAITALLVGAAATVLAVAAMRPDAARPPVPAPVVPEAPPTDVFGEIRSVRIRYIGPDGLAEVKMDAAQEQSLFRCLQRTERIEPADALPHLLHRTYLLEVDEVDLDRSFELYTKENLKGNKGMFYRNTCLLAVIEAR